MLYPNILLVSNCSGFYVAELFGITKIYDGLKLKRHKEESIYSYLSQFDVPDPDSLIPLNSKNTTLRLLCLAQDPDFGAIENRFPSIGLYESRFVREGGKGSLISFEESFESCSIENSILINRNEHLYRCKSILSAWIFRNSVTKSSFVEFCNHILKTNLIKGVQTVKGETSERLVIAGQLQSMYLFPGLHETTIGEFLKLHPEIIKKAFKTDHFEYEPYLEWKEHDGTCDDIAINPDLFVKRPDGFFDIYDLKTAALTRKNITKGKRKRRRFIDYVEEGIAQLANYQEYFNYPLNAQHAKEKIRYPNQRPKASTCCRKLG